MFFPLLQSRPPFFFRGRINKKERFEKVRLTEKDRELRANQKSDDVLINKALKKMRNIFYFWIVIFGIAFYELTRLIPDEVYWLKAWFAVLYVFMLAAMLWAYRWRARTYRKKVIVFINR